MKKLAFCSLMLVLSAPVFAGDSAKEQAREYCSSMLQAGTPEEEVKQFLSECIAEQESYFAEPEETETGKPDCYEQVDAHIEKAMNMDPSQYYDYESLLDQCLSGKSFK